MKDKYCLLFKTGDAEIRGLEQSNNIASKIFPIVELTRGRLSVKDKVGLISKRLQKLNNIFSNQTICLDLTTDKNLTNNEITNYYSYENGYSNWINFIKKVNSDYSFKEIIPTILLDTDDPNLAKNLLLQVENLSKISSKIAYRSNIVDEGYWEDLSVIEGYLNKSSVELLFIIDCEYLPAGAVYRAVDLINARITNVKSKINTVTFVVVSTSFPRYVSDIGNESYDLFPISEIELYDHVKRINPDILYGDYGSINPIRNDTITMARGWRPRIDVPTHQGIYYYRIKRNTYSYAYAYTMVAGLAYKDEKFPHYLNGNWGVNQIIECKNGNAPGSSPSFWISVRFSIFIDMQIKRLKI